MIRSLFLALFMAPPLAVFADGYEDDPAAQMTACVEEHASSESELAGCIDAAHRECLQYPLNTAPEAAIKCFLDRKKLWGDAISARMDRLKVETDEQSFEITRINIRYDLTANLLQCDRLTELAQLQNQPEQRIQAQQTRCEATATGLTFVKLLLQSGGTE